MTSAVLQTFTEDTPRGEPFTRKDDKGQWQLVQPLCMIGPFQRLWGETLVEIIRQFDVDSMGLCPDEFYWSNSQLGYTCNVQPDTNTPFYCDCRECRQTFENASGHALPSSGRSRILQGDTPVNRSFMRVSNGNQDLT